MKVIVDIFGGDYAPIEIVKGCVDALSIDKSVNLILSGDKTKVEAELGKYSVDRSRIEIIDAPEVITNDESPTSAIRAKRNSSLVMALDRLKTDPDAAGLVSAGSTGAVLTGAVLKLGRMEGVSRPALAPVLPTINKDKKVILIDCGANTDCKPEFLAQFALMGSAYMNKVFGIENPKVALLSNGAEDKKGNELTKAAFPLLKELPINFVGNLEARYVMSGEVDVVVSDGFDGNICLKSLEGTSTLIFDVLKQEIMAGAMSKIGYLFMKKAFKNLRNRLDYSKGGGALFLGCNKVVVKAHGTSKAITIANSIMQVIEFNQKKVLDGISDYMSKVIVPEEKSE